MSDDVLMVRKNALETRLGVPLEFSSGWISLVERLVDAIDALDIPYEVDQVKEKFGGLRFYWHQPYPEGEIPDDERADRREASTKIRALIDAAEAESIQTCEICGAPGRPQGKGWIRTLCDDHATG